MTGPTLGDVARGRRYRMICGLCVDNVVYADLDIETENHISTGPVPVCWPCLTERLDAIKHDIDARLHGIPFVLGRIIRFEVRVR